MAAIPTVLGSVAKIFAWVIPYQTGGILNILFTPLDNESLVFNSNIDTNQLKEYAKMLLLGKGTVSYKVLEMMPDHIGGGEKGVAEAQSNPSREAVFLTGPIVALVLMIIALVGLFAINSLKCCCGCLTCCCRSSKRKNKAQPNGLDVMSEYYKKSEHENYTESYHSDKYDIYDNNYNYDDDDDIEDYWKKTKFGGGLARRIKKATSKSTFLVQKQGHICCCCHIVTVVLATIYVAGLIFSVCFYFAAAGEVVGMLEAHDLADEDVTAWVNGEVETISLGRAIQYGVVHSVNFLQKSSESGEKETMSAVTKLNTIIQTELNSSVPSLLDGVMDNFNISTIVNGTIEEITNFGYFANNVSYVSTERDDVVKGLNEFKVKLEDLYDKTCNACQTTNSCDSIVEMAKKVLLLDIDENKIKMIDKTLSELITNVSRNMTILQTKLKNINTELTDLKEKAVEVITEKVNLNSVIEPLSDFWNDLALQTGEISEQIETALETLPTLVGKISPIVKVALYIPGAVMIVIAIILTVFLLLFLCEAFRKRLFSSTGESASLIAANERRRPKSRVCKSCCFCCTSIVLLIVIVLAAVLATAFLIITTLLAAEVCPYIAEENGMKKSDFVINKMLADQWNSTIGGSSQQDIGGIIELKQPENILTTIAFACGNTTDDLGLLAKLGFQQFINLNAVVQSDEVKDAIKNGETAVITEILNANISGHLPLEDIKELTEILVDLKMSIETIKSEEIANYLDNIIQPKDLFEEFIYLLHNKTNNETLVNMTKDVADEVESFRINIKDLSDAYRGINNGINVIGNFTLLNSTLHQLGLALSNQTQLNESVAIPFTNTTTEALQTLSIQGTEVVNRLTDTLLPCEELSLGLRAILYTPCGISGLNPRLFAWSLLLTMMALFTFLSFVGLFNLWCIQNHQRKRFA